MKIWSLYAKREDMCMTAYSESDSDREHHWRAQANGDHLINMTESSNVFVHEVAIKYVEPFYGQY